MSNEDTIDEGSGGDREGKPVRSLTVSQASKEKIARKIKNFKEKKMSNEGMNEALRNQEKPGMGTMTNDGAFDGKGDPVTNRNTRRVLEEILEDNLISATKVLGLVRQVGDSLFGAKPVEVGEKESAETASSFFNRTRDVALKTKYRLGEIRDELQEILKELK